MKQTRPIAPFAGRSTARQRVLEEIGDIDRPFLARVFAGAETGPR